MNQVNLNYLIGPVICMRHLIFLKVGDQNHQCMLNFMYHKNNQIDHAYKSLLFLILLTFSPKLKICVAMRDKL